MKLTLTTIPGLPRYAVRASQSQTTQSPGRRAVIAFLRIFNSGKVAQKVLPVLRHAVRPGVGPDRVHNVDTTGGDDLDDNSRPRCTDATTVFRPYCNNITYFNHDTPYSNQHLYYTIESRGFARFSEEFYRSGRSVACRPGTSAASSQPSSSPTCRPRSIS